MVGYPDFFLIQAKLRDFFFPLNPEKAIIDKIAV